MVNKNYIRGYITEKKAQKELENEGFYVVRSSGSHTMYDLVAMNHTLIRLIQLKRVKGKYYSFKHEIEEIDEFDNHPKNATKELWIYLDRIKGRPAQWKKITIGG